MSIVMYKTENNYYYAVEIGMPEHTVRFGEADSPVGAVRDMDDTQYQSAYFSCRGPANEELSEYFPSVDRDDVIVDYTDAEEAEAQAEYDYINSIVE